mgnify:CR=1 FL=1|jgi:hypothetical protein
MIIDKEEMGYVMNVHPVYVAQIMLGAKPISEEELRSLYTFLVERI